MADWYASSVAHAAVPVYTISTAYTVGQFVRRITSTPKSQWVMRVTTAGTSAASEPTWPTANGGTVTSGGATFTNVTGQSAYGWSAAAGDIPTLTARFTVPDRMFVSSDHTETQTSTTDYGYSGSSSYTQGQILSVNRAGSVPPVAADLTAGATVTVGSTFSTLNFSANCPIYYYGIVFAVAGSNNSISFGTAGGKTLYFNACQFYLNTSSTTITNSGVANVVWNNTTLRFTAAGQFIRNTSNNLLEIVWQNTPSAIAGTAPTVLISPTANQSAPLLTARGVDLSAITGTLVGTNGIGAAKCLFDSCRIASGVVRYIGTANANSRELIELVNCYDGTNIISESWQPAGAVTTERTITLSGGATDDVGTFSHKLVSTANVDKYVGPLTGFWLDIEQQAVGSSKTATVEIISSASLNNDEISLLLEYQGTSGSPVATFTTTLPATVLTTAAAVTTSTATWNSSPASPVKQKLVATFTPQVAGRVRGQVRLGKASTTVYVDPVITIT